MLPDVGRSRLLVHHPVDQDGEERAGPAVAADAAAVDLEARLELHDRPVDQLVEVRHLLERPAVRDREGHLDALGPRVQPGGLLHARVEPDVDIGVGHGRADAGAAMDHQAVAQGEGRVPLETPLDRLVDLLGLVFLAAHWVDLLVAVHAARGSLIFFSLTPGSVPMLGRVRNPSWSFLAAASASRTAISSAFFCSAIWAGVNLILAFSLA